MDSVRLGVTARRRAEVLGGRRMARRPDGRRGRLDGAPPPAAGALKSRRLRQAHSSECPWRDWCNDDESKAAFPCTLPAMIGDSTSELADGTPRILPVLAVSRSDQGTPSIPASAYKIPRRSSQGESAAPRQHYFVSPRPGRLAEIEPGFSSLDSGYGSLNRAPWI